MQTLTDWTLAGLGPTLLVSKQCTRLLPASLAPPSRAMRRSKGEMSLSTDMPLVFLVSGLAEYDEDDWRSVQFKAVSGKDTDSLFDVSCRTVRLVLILTSMGSPKDGLQLPNGNLWTT